MLINENNNIETTFSSSPEFALCGFVLSSFSFCTSCPFCTLYHLESLSLDESVPEPPEQNKKIAYFVNKYSRKHNYFGKGLSLKKVFKNYYRYSPLFPHVSFSFLFWSPLVLLQHPECPLGSLFSSLKDLTLISQTCPSPSRDDPTNTKIC